MLKNPYPKYSEVHSYASIMFFHFLMPYILTTYDIYMYINGWNTAFHFLFASAEIFFYTTIIVSINYKTLDWNKYWKEELVLYYLLLINPLGFFSGIHDSIYGIFNTKRNLLIELVNNLTDILSCLPF